MSLRLPRPHARPWSGAFNVVMATAIVSIACHQAGLGTVSTVLMWVAIGAFAPLAVLDLARATHPAALLHRAEEPGRAFHALGFVADACVLGSRVAPDGGVPKTLAIVLLLIGAGVWGAISLTVTGVRERVLRRRPAGEWLLAVVSTEGLAILLQTLAPRWRPLAIVLWALGGALYVLIGALLIRRWWRHGLSPDELTPDWWIVMGAPAIFTLSAATLRPHGLHSPLGVLALLGWATASVCVAPMLAGEAWRVRRLGRPRFTPQRWTMVFPLGMYSACSQLVGERLQLGWMHTVGQVWVAVALTAWLLVAGGELHYAFRPAGQRARLRAQAPPR